MKVIDNIVKIEERSNTLRLFLTNNIDNFQYIAQVIHTAFKNGNKLFLCGNGGSAAECQHIAAEFTATLNKDNRKALPAISLTTDTSFITAYSNDFNYSGIFSRQLRALSNEGDILIALSTSGKSKNILQALEEANKLKLFSIFFIGVNNYEITHDNEFVISTGSSCVQITQELHLTALHIITEIIDSKF